MAKVDIEIIAQDVIERVIQNLRDNEALELLINDFRDYQKEWLTSRKDIELDIPKEDLILAFLDDTADCYISEHRKGARTEHDT